MWALYQNDKLLGGDEPIIRASEEKAAWQLEYFTKQGFEGLQVKKVEIVPCSQ